MNSVVTKASAIFSSKVNASTHLRAVLFHSTPVLYRRKNDSHESRRKYYTRRSRKKQKEELYRNATSYAERLFKKLEREFDESGPSSSEDASWFRRQHPKGPRKGPTSNQGSQHRGRRVYQFCEDDDSEFETIFQHAFGGNRHSFWSFIIDEDPPWRSSSKYSNNHTRWSNKSRYWFEDDSESDSTEQDSSKSDRAALGLSPSGALKIKDVKDAYRACAMKWHPDRHQGSSKTVAEEKFKLCSAAYQSLCEKLAVN